MRRLSCLGTMSTWSMSEARKRKESAVDLSRPLLLDHRQLSNSSLSLSMCRRSTEGSRRGPTDMTKYINLLSMKSLRVRAKNGSLASSVLLNFLCHLSIILERFHSINNSLVSLSTLF